MLATLGNQGQTLQAAHIGTQHFGNGDAARPNYATYAPLRASGAHHEPWVGRWVGQMQPPLSTRQDRGRHDLYALIVGMAA